MTEHFFYDKREADAAALRTTVRDEGVLAMFERSATQGTWLVKAYTSRSNEDDFEALVEHFSVLATRHRSEYDGYGTYVGPLEALLSTEDRPADQSPGGEPGG